MKISEVITEGWSQKYKSSINCANPKGFSQKAHCKARRLRQMGKKTKSKPVREIYEAVVRHMLKEFDSSMAMGALKQLNSDAKELDQMLQPNTQLEDWVKAKLNLAGEYLDDVYHHLDHFGPEGRKFDEVKVANDIDWPTWMAGRGLLDLPDSWFDSVGEAAIRVEEFEDDDKLVIRADVPGVNPDEDIEITMTDGMLRIMVHHNHLEENRLYFGYCRILKVAF